MLPEQREKFIEVLAGVHDFYGRELSEFAATVWLQACDTFDVQQVSKALSAHLMDPERGQFMPKPADIVRQLQGTHTDRALIAWGKVLDAAQRVGAYQSVVFDDGIIHAVVEDMGGWSKLARSGSDELPFVQRRFCETYRAYSGRPDVSFPARLPGQFELENASKGRKVSAPMLIGNPERAAQVLASGLTAPKTQITHAEQVLRLVGSSKEHAA